MEHSSFHTLKITIAGLFLLAAGLTAAYFFPWQQIKWGQLELAPSRLITVTGNATERQQNQVAQFSAGVSAVNDDKNNALEQVNQAMDKLVAEIKEFGIETSDIKTENVSVYQGEETYYEDGQPKQRPGQWRVNNSVTVILRNIDRASVLTQLLTKSGATNVYGPSFRLDTDSQPGDALLADAIDNARKKAEAMATASGGKLGKVISVTEGSAASQVYPLAMADGRGGGGGEAIEPGASTVSKQVTVAFELVTD